MLTTEWIAARNRDWLRVIPLHFEPMADRSIKSILWILEYPVGFTRRTDRTVAIDFGYVTIPISVATNAEIETFAFVNFLANDGNSFAIMSPNEGTDAC